MQANFNPLSDNLCSAHHQTDDYSKFYPESVSGARGLVATKQRVGVVPQVPFEGRMNVFPDAVNIAGWQTGGELQELILQHHASNTRVKAVERAKQTSKWKYR